MGSFSVDFSELRTFAADLRSVDAALTRHLRPPLEKAALNVKRQLSAEMRDSRHFRAAGGFINYDAISPGGDVMGFEVGPDKETPADIANIAYFGSSRRGGGTVPDPEIAFKAEVENLIPHLEELAERFTL